MRGQSRLPPRSEGTQEFGDKIDDDALRTCLVWILAHTNKKNIGHTRCEDGTALAVAMYEANRLAKFFLLYL